MRDVGTVGAAAAVAEPVGVDHAQIRVGEQREVETGVTRERGARLRRIDGHPRDRTATRAEGVETQLQALQLRDAEGSPGAAIEDEQERTSPEVGEPDRLSALIGEREVRRRGADRRSVRLGHGAHDVEERRERGGEEHVQREERSRCEPPPAVARATARDASASPAPTRIQFGTAAFRTVGNRAPNRKTTRK